MDASMRTATILLFYNLQENASLNIYFLNQYRIYTEESQFETLGIYFHTIFSQTLMVHHTGRPNIPNHSL